MRGQGFFSNRFVGEWTYILGLAAGRCREWVLSPPSDTAMRDTQQFLECRDRVTVGDSPKSSRSIDALNQHGSTTASAGLGFTPQAPSRP